MDTVRCIMLLAEVVTFVVPVCAVAGYWDARFGGLGGQGVDSGLNAVAVSGSDVYVGGQFTSAGSVYATNIAKWNGHT